ncbi:MAG TPA: ABC transporter permease, partial [Lachnospiraceae bacterium]|nr:ABC transporter permease [Lachnospiraceae bacterium]
MQKKKKIRPFDILNYTIMILVGMLCILPFVHLLAVSFSESSAVSAGKVGLLPVDFTLQSYEFALTGGKFLRALLVSVKRVILGCGTNMVLMVLTAYPLSKTKRDLMGRNIYMGFFVVTMIINGGLIPTYLVVTKAGLLNSMWALILPGALPVYNMIILMNFIRGLPEELEEAAKIDGAGKLTVLIRIVLPLLKPALATVGLFCMVNHWNDWFSGMIYMQSPENYPLQTYLQTLLRNFDEILKSAGSDYAQLISMMNARTG